MSFPQQFEGPAGTLFLRQREGLRIISYEGEETIVPLPEFLGFLIHLTTQHAAVVCVADGAVRLQGRLAALLASDA
jgi:hypothetical protein